MIPRMHVLVVQTKKKRKKKDKRKERKERKETCVRAIVHVFWR